MVATERTACAGARGREPAHTRQQSQVSDNDTVLTQTLSQSPQIAGACSSPPPRKTASSAPLGPAGSAEPGVLSSPGGRGSPPPTNAFPVSNGTATWLSGFEPRGRPSPSAAEPSHWRSLWPPHQSFTVCCGRREGDGTEPETGHNSTRRGGRETLAGRPPALLRCARPSRLAAPPLPHPRLPRRGRRRRRPHRAMPSHRSSAAAAVRRATAAAAARAAASR